MRNPTHFEVAAVACGLLLGCLTLPSSASPSLGDAARRAKAIETYEHALRLRTRLHSRPEGRRPIGAYLKLIQTFQAVYRLDPAYAGSPAALADAAALYREVGRQFSDDRYYRAAIKSSNLLITVYPRSLLSRDALLTIGEIYASDLNQPDDARRVYKKFLERYPNSAKTTAVRERLKRISRSSDGRLTNRTATDSDFSERAGPASVEARPEAEPERESPGAGDQSAGSQPKPRALTEVTGVRCWVGSNYTRIVITLEDEVKFNASHVLNPDRLVFDFSGTRLSRALVGKTFPVEDGFLRQVRVAQYQPSVTRAVLDVRKIVDYSVFSLPNPFRLVIDIHGAPGERAGKSRVHIPRVQEPAAPAATAANAGGDDLALSRPGSESTATVEGVTPASNSVAASDDQAGERLSADVQTSVQPSEKNRETPSPSALQSAGDGPRGNQPSATLRAGVIPHDGPDDEQATDAAEIRPALRPRSGTSSTRGAPPTDASSAEPAARPETGSRTLTRVLGLKIGKIVIDAGHGGHDTGTVGPHGLCEKDLVLDVALRLKALIERNTDAEVVMTRRDDTFIPLEERTAIANQRGADLFISIHANASRDPGARGIETYYLNFTSDPQALEVAARENATSAESVHQLQTLVKKIVLTEKINESREFAAHVQRELYSSVTKAAGGQENRGVKRAPFVVLIGANMPSILAEISFLSNPRDERLLRRPEYRQKIGEALYRGIARYTNDLGGPSVAEKGPGLEEVQARPRRRPPLQPAQTSTQ